MGSTSRECHALMKGLGSKSETEINAAVYLASTLGDLEQEGEWYFMDGHGVLNASVSTDLASKLPYAFGNEFPENEEFEEDGEDLAQYGDDFDLDVIATRLYEKREDSDISGYQEAKEISGNRKEIDDKLEEIRRQLSS